MATRILLLIPATNNSEMRHIQRKFLRVPFSGKSVKQFLTSDAQFFRNISCLSLLKNKGFIFAIVTVYPLACALALSTRNIGMGGAG